MLIVEIAAGIVIVAAVLWVIGVIAIANGE